MSKRNYKEIGMHPLTYHNNAIHNLKPFLEKAKTAQNCGQMKVYQPDNSVHIPNADTISQLLPNCTPDISNIRYNNITKTIKNETIIEQVITVNSHDRNFLFYKNPYSYTVKFNPMDKSVIKQSNGTYKTIPGDPRPHIKANFNNIRYFKLELTILPTKLYNIIRTVDNTTMTNLQTSLDNNTNYVDNQEVGIDGKTIKIIYYENDGNNYEIEFLVVDGTESTTCYNWSKSNGVATKYKYVKTLIKDITKIPFTTIVLDEITDVNEYSTSDTVSRSFNTLYPYQTRDEYSNFHTANVDKIFKFYELGTLKKLKIQFTDNLGVPFSIDNLNTSTWVKNEATDEIINGSTSLKSPSIYIRHPLHGNYQNHILFKVGTIETEIDKNIYC